VVFGLGLWSLNSGSLPVDQRPRPKAKDPKPFRFIAHFTFSIYWVTHKDFNLFENDK